jgi:hypothetical protein
MENQEALVIEQRLASFGEILIGIELNSEDNDKVAQVKKKMVEIADIMKDAYAEDMRSPVKSLLFDHAVGEIVNAQMSVVKVLTFK